VGAGSLGFHHIRILRDVDDAQLVGFFEERTERAEKVSSELGVKSYADLATLLDDVDAVTIVVPTPLHFEVAKQALDIEDPAYHKSWLDAQHASFNPPTS